MRASVVLWCPLILKLTLLWHTYPLRPPSALHVWPVTAPMAGHHHGNSGRLCQKKGCYSLCLAVWWVGWIVFLPAFWCVTLLSCD